MNAELLGPDSTEITKSSEQTYELEDQELVARFASLMETVIHAGEVMDQARANLDTNRGTVEELRAAEAAFNHFSAIVPEYPVNIRQRYAEAERKRGRRVEQVIGNNF